MPPSNSPDINVLPLFFFVEILQEKNLYHIFLENIFSPALCRPDKETALCICAYSVNNNPLVKTGTGLTSTFTVQLMRCSGLSSCVMVRYARRFSSRLLSSRASSSPDCDRYLWRLQCSSSLHIQTNTFHGLLFSFKGYF